MLGVSICKNFGACLYWRFAERDASGVPIMKQVIGSFIHHKEPIPRSAVRFLDLGFADDTPWVPQNPRKKAAFFFLLKVQYVIV